jgi:glycosyltransferase
LLVNFSIITAVRNGAGTLGKCLESVRCQSVRPEHVIVDGASTDGTVELLRAWTGHRLEVKSEPDMGIYDAMNKGIGRAQGDIVGILNADDSYASDRVLERVRKAMLDPDVDACYGDLVYVKEEGRRQKAELGREKEAGRREKGTERVTRYWRSGEGTARSFYWGWMPPHPTFFVRRTVYQRCGLFRLDMGSAADYEFMLRALVKHRLRAAYEPTVLVRMRVGGLSNAALSNRWRANRMDRRAWTVNGLRPYPGTLWLKPLRKISQWWVGEIGKGEGGVD